MAYLRFCWDNLYAASATVLTPTSVSTTLPALASANPDRNYVFRSATIAVAVAIDIDLGSVKAVTSVAVANLLLFSGGGAFELHERGDGGSPGAETLVATIAAADYDSTRKTAFKFFASQSHRHWRIKWTNPGAVSAYVEVGFVFLGTYFEPAKPPMPPTSRIVNPSPVSLAPDGGRAVVTRTMYDEVRIHYPVLSTADRSTFESMYRTNGAGVPVFAVLDTTLSWTCWMAFFANDAARVFLRGRQYEFGVTLEEAR